MQPAQLAPMVDDLVEAYADDLIDALASLQRSRSSLAAMEAHLLVRIAGTIEQRRRVEVIDEESGTTRYVTIADEVREEVAAALHRSPAVVHDQIVNARLLFGPLRSTLDALAAGVISEGHARIVCEQARRLLRNPALADDDEAFAQSCRALQERVLHRAVDLTPSQTRALARRVVSAIDAEGERVRREQARLTADVVVTPEDDGMAVLVARLPEVDARRIGAVIDAHARALDMPCGSPIGERRAAALVGLVCGSGMGIDVDRDGSAERVGIEVTVTVPLDELLDPRGSLGGLVDDPDVPMVLRRLVTDPHTGAALDLGRRRYEVSDALRRWIAARDRTCTFPGCGRRAELCDIDHVDSWNAGGATDGANLQALCRRHHQLKTHGGWRVVAEANGERTWLSPRGRPHRRRPAVAGDVDAEAVPVASPGPEWDEESPPF